VLFPFKHQIQKVEHGSIMQNLKNIVHALESSILEQQMQNVEDGSIKQT
jgi:hypothetical protein